MKDLESRGACYLNTMVSWRSGLNQMPVNYDALAEQYRRYRTPDARIASAIWAHLDGAEHVLNVGAGIGSYEPISCKVLAVEP